MSRPQNRCFVAMKLPTRVPDLLTTARAILLALTNNASLPKPTPSIATLRAAIDALDEAQTETHSRTLGKVATRDAALSQLLAALRRYKAYVQEQADGDPENAETLIGSSGLSVRKPKPRGKGPFSVKPGATSGSVIVEVKAISKRASYKWAWSADGGETWNAAQATLPAKTTITGLPASKIVSFRYRPVTKEGQGDWSEPFALLVK